MHKPAWILILKIVLLGVGALAIMDSAAAQQAPGDMTERLCTACHGDKFAALANNPHSALDTGGGLICIDCHGSVAEHIRNGGGRGSVFAFRDEPPRSQVERCLNCHAGTHPDFDRSPHAGLSCGSCHSQHGAGFDAASLLREPSVPAALAAVGAKSAVCFDCHGEIFTQFSFNERHRLREGVLECVSCHDPHAAATRASLGGFKQESCTDCHTDKRGPFVFEHAASRTDDCTACHSPHGSPNRHMLQHARVAELCLSCHADVPQFHLGFAPGGPPRFNLDTQCTNCHSSIHGSNFHPAFLR